MRRDERIKQRESELSRQLTVWARENCLILGTERVVCKVSIEIIPIHERKALAAAKDIYAMKATDFFTAERVSNFCGKGVATKIKGVIKNLVQHIDTLDCSMGTFITLCSVKDIVNTVHSGKRIAEIISMVIQDAGLHSLKKE